MPSAQHLIAEQFPDSLVAVWGVNRDATLDWFGPYRQTYGLTIPILHHADSVFSRYHVGGELGVWPPAYIVIDKRGAIRHRSNVLGSISIQQVSDLVRDLLTE
jgi:hypothetical protein